MPKPELTHIRYEAPDPDTGGYCEIYLTIEQAIALQQKVADERKYIYPTSDDALKDFMVIHWAERVMAPSVRDAYMKRMEATLDTLSHDFAGFGATHSWVAALLLKAHYVLYPENKPKDISENNKTDS